MIYIYIYILWHRLIKQTYPKYHDIALMWLNFPKCGRYLTSFIYKTNTARLCEYFWYSKTCHFSTERKISTSSYFLRGKCVVCLGNIYSRTVSMSWFLLQSMYQLFCRWCSGRTFLSWCSTCVWNRRLSCRYLTRPGKISCGAMRTECLGWAWQRSSDWVYRLSWWTHDVMITSLQRQSDVAFGHNWLMTKHTWSSLIRVMAWCLFSTKPLPKPMMIKCHIALT